MDTTTRLLAALLAWAFVTAAANPFFEKRWLLRVTVALLIAATALFIAMPWLGNPTHG